MIAGIVALTVVAMVGGGLAACAAVTAVVVPADGVNVRTEPRAAGEVAYVAPRGSRLQLTDKCTVVDGVAWWELEDGNWVQGQYLHFEHSGDGQRRGVCA